ncbi:MAG: hypothetical protein AAF125_19940 [Chloroflexota bacterium]
MFPWQNDRPTHTVEFVADGYNPTLDEIPVAGNGCAALLIPAGIFVSLLAFAGCFWLWRATIPNDPLPTVAPEPELAAAYIYLTETEQARPTATWTPTATHTPPPSLTPTGTWTPLPSATWTPTVTGTPLPIFCEGAPFDRYEPGMMMRVVFDGNGALRLLDRARVPGEREPNVLKQLYNGDVVIVTAAAVCGSWQGSPVAYYPVDVPRWERSGWVGFGQSGDVWLEGIG